jgi:hypothetical protein
MVGEAYEIAAILRFGIHEITRVYPKVSGLSRNEITKNNR